MALFGNNKCAHCGAPLKIIEKAKMGLKPARLQRCKACQLQAHKALEDFAVEFREACEDAVITNEEWQSLWASLQPAGVTHDEAMAFIHRDVLQFMDRLIDLIFEDGVVTDEEEVYFRRMISVLEITPKDMAMLRMKWEGAKIRCRLSPGLGEGAT
jgi:hypothetical protein